MNTQHNPLQTLLALMLVAAMAGATGWYLASRKQSHQSMAGAVPAAQQKAERRILYYRNPMGLPDTSPVPKKDAMGMDYVPVYADEAQAAGVVSINPDKVQILGVRTERARMATLSRSVRALGTIEPDERRLFEVAPRFEGWIERLFANETGRLVERGDALFSVYSPELAATQREFLLARGAAGSAGEGLRRDMETLSAGARERLRNWEIGPSEVAALEERGTADGRIVFRAPQSGVILRKNAVEGARFMAGESLYRLADLSTLWVIAEVYEQDLPLLRPGQQAHILVDAFAGEEFRGTVSFIYPTLNAATRTARLRIELANPQMKLRPAMYAQIEIETGSGSEARLTVPESAVLDSGERRVVLIARGEGMYEPREVRTAERSGGRIAVLDGLAEGEEVVVSANFLIDAESNLRAALQSFGESGGTAATQESEPAPAAMQHHHHGGH